MDLISCRQATSGLAIFSQPVSASSRALMPFMLNVAIFIAKGPGWFGQV
jgi:hypothetical protein